jgi:hypothetical protein
LPNAAQRSLQCTAFLAQVRRLTTQLSDSLGGRVLSCLPALEDLTLAGELAQLLAGNAQQAMWRVVRAAQPRLSRLALQGMDSLTDSTAAMLLACQGLREVCVRHCWGISGAALLQVGPGSAAGAGMGPAAAAAAAEPGAEQAAQQARPARRTPAG